MGASNLVHDIFADNPVFELVGESAEQGGDSDAGDVESGASGSNSAGRVLELKVGLPFIQVTRSLSQVQGYLGPFS